jgi:outer membrane protein OmpA-like peptidoglycan-associated protein
MAWAAWQSLAVTHRIRKLFKLSTLDPLVFRLHKSPVRFQTMNAFLVTTCIVTGTLLAGGCATKKYVNNTAAPIQAKVDQVGEQTSRNGQQIEDTRSQVKQVDEKAQSGISAAQERAGAADQHAATADQHAGAAQQRADQANQLGEKNTQELVSLRSVVANLDDYKLQTSVAVPFSFNKYALSTDAKTDLDKLATDVKSGRRFFIAVEGYTDSTGSKAYNETLSRQRADQVVEYLVAKHDIPIYRIHTIGLGEEKPVDEARNRTARAKNRRVEVKVFSADQATESLNSTTTGSSSREVKP